MLARSCCDEVTINNKFHIIMERRVIKTRKDADGDILGLCGNWGVNNSLADISKQNAIDDISCGRCRYYVIDSGQKVYITVVNGPNGHYLRTERDCTRGNNLDELPDC